MDSSPTRPRQIIFLRKIKSDCLGCVVLLCFVVCLTLLASFLYSSSSLIKHSHMYTCTMLSPFLQLHKALFGKFLEENMYPLYATIAVTAFLLRKGADIHQANKSGRSPYQYMPFIATLMTVLADYDEIM